MAAGNVLFDTRLGDTTTIDGMVIGGSTPANATFVNVVINGTLTGAGVTVELGAPGPIGNVTPNTGAFTTLTATSTVTFSPASHNVVLSPSGTGVVTINPATLGTLDHVTVGGTTPAVGTFTTLTATAANAPTINAGADASAGTISIFPATTATGKTTLTAASNSGATTTNINTAAQAGARTYTVPDAGGSANFMLSAATLSATTGLTSTTVPMTGMRTATGLMMTASASSTNYGITYTPGTTAILAGTATSSSSTSNVAACDVVLPATYIAGTNITLSVGCYYTNSSSTASVHTMAAAAYLNTAAGLQGSTLIATSAQTVPITTSALQTFTITGATLVPGSYLTLTFSLAMTNGAGASTGFLTSVSFT